MSQRKVKRKQKKEQKKSCNEPADFLTSFYPVIDEETEELDIISFIAPIDSRDVPYLPLYLEAHKLLPSNYVYCPDRTQRELEKSLSDLAVAEDLSGNILRALAILGHSPCAKSIETLVHWSREDSLYGAVARIALSECLGLTGDDGRSVLN